MRALLVAILRIIADTRPTIVVIDDGQYMDSASWDVVLDFATNGKRLFAVAKDPVTVADVGPSRGQGGHGGKTATKDQVYIAPIVQRPCSFT